MNKIEKIMATVKGGYNYYYDDKYAVGSLPGGGKSLVNCSDDRVTRNQEVRNKIHKLGESIEITGEENLLDLVSPVIHEMHKIIKNDLMENGLNETEANLLIDRTIVFNHWEFKEVDGKQYVSIKPMLRDEYEKQVQEHFQR